ncbi:MAG: hypothetical protein NVSMB38_17030 [Ktedonobacteraceae bacterium]
MRGFGELMVNHTEIVRASNQIHARFKRMEAVSGMARFARQTCQSLPECPIQTLNKGCIEDTATLRSLQ